MSNTKPTGQNLCLLTLDGGGVRGLSSLYLLKQLMYRINPESPPKPCDIFDVIGGTSTGGLIAIMLGRLKMDVDSCIDAYTDMADTIFQKVAHRVTLGGKVQARFDSERLNEAIKTIIKQQGLQEDEVFIEKPAPSCKVFVCATRGESRTLTRITSYYTERSANDDKIKIWEACRATSAASTFFDPITIGKHGETYLDGATGANNPIRQLWSAAKDLWSEGHLEDRLNCIVSIGTGRPSLEPFGSSIKDVAETLLAITTDTEEHAESFSRENPDLAREKKYFRFNVDRGLEGIGLERSEKSATIVAATRTYLESQTVFESVLDCKKKLAARYVLLNVSIRQSIPFEEDPDFVGREDELFKIDKFFKSHGRIALVGMGGVGKSQIAIKYLYQLKRQYPNTWIFWVFASTRGRFMEAYQKIAAEINLPQRNDPDVNILQLVADWMNRPNHSMPWVMVLDNADDVNMFVETNSDPSATVGLHKASDDPLIMYLPDAERGKVLITARDTGAAINFTGSEENIILIKPMSVADAKYLMYKKLDAQHSSDPDIERLVKLLGALPLALTQAASYINSSGRRMTLDKYITLLTSSQMSSLKLLERETPDDRRDASQSSSIVTTWQVSFDHILQRNLGACELLCFMAMLDGQGIPEFLLAQLVPDSLDLEDHLSLLLQFSFVSNTQDQSVFKVHFLVGLAVVRWLKSRNEYDKWNSKTLEILCKSFPSRHNELWIGKPVWDKRRILLPHVQRLLEYYSTEREALLCRATLLQQIALDSVSRRCFRQRDSEALEALELRRQLLGENDILTADAYSTVASIRELEGDFETAQRFYEKAYRIALDHGGMEHMITGEIVGDLCELLISLDCMVEAENLAKKAYEARKSVFGNHHFATLRSMMILSSVYRMSHQYDAAESMDIALLAAHLKLLGPSHPATLSSTLNLVMSLASAYKLSDATMYLDRVDKELEAPATHGDVDGHIKLMAYQTGMYLSLQKHDAPVALQKTKEGLNMMSDEIGTSSSIFYRFSQTAITVWSNMDCLDDATALAHRSLEALQQNIGPDHRKTLEYMAIYSHMLARKGQNSQAEELARNAMSLSRARNGERHPITLSIELFACKVFELVGDYKSMAQLSRHVYDIRRETLGQDNFSTADALRVLGASAKFLDNYSEADTQYHQAMETYWKIFGLDHPKTMAAMVDIMWLYTQVSNSIAEHAKCEKYADIIVPFFEQRLGPDHPFTMNFAFAQASVKQKLEKWEESEKILTPLLANQKRRFGPDHEKPALTAMGLFSCCVNLGKPVGQQDQEIMRVALGRLDAEYNKAGFAPVNFGEIFMRVADGRILMEDAVEILEGVYNWMLKNSGPDHPRTIEALGALESGRKALAANHGKLAQQN